MAISFDKALGVHQHTVGVRSQRAETLASNLANANTPGIKPKMLTSSVRFKRQLQGQKLALAEPMGGT